MQRRDARGFPSLVVTNPFNPFDTGGQQECRKRGLSLTVTVGVKMDNTKNQSKIITTCKTMKFQCYCYRRCSNTQFLLDSFLTRIQEDLLGVTDDFSFNATMHRCSHEQSCRESTEKTHCSESTDTYSLLLDQPQNCQVSIDNKYTVKRLRATHNFHYYPRGRTKGWSSRARGYMIFRNGNEKKVKT